MNERLTRALGVAIIAGLAAYTDAPADPQPDQPGEPLPLWRREFASFPADAVPDDLPDGFDDQSWHNDVSPSFLHQETGLLLWIDHPDRSQREMGDSARFTLTQMVLEDEVGAGPFWSHSNSAGKDSEVVCTADRWEGMRAVLVAMIDGHKASHPLGALTGIYQAWLASQGLPSLSCDELLMSEALTAAQRQWASGFYRLWEAEEQRLQNGGRA